MSGVFDLLHEGHIHYLLQARTNVDRLIVGVDDDPLVAAKKGPNRPVESVQQRLDKIQSAGLSNSLFIKRRSIEYYAQRLLPNVWFYPSTRSPDPDRLKRLRDLRVDSIELPTLPGISTSKIIKDRDFSEE